MHTADLRDTAFLRSHGSLRWYGFWCLGFGRMFTIATDDGVGRRRSREVVRMRECRLQRGYKEDLNPRSRYDIVPSPGVTVTDLSVKNPVWRPEPRRAGSLGGG
ncbi:hypothetical protein SBA3_2220023 [Candidatus Sulfopaludibacter sp. SbA3]|nr:hypothetical protein SBA3_2220023 [Candidatus Sulfopaludibacter sp. SbA3]